MSSSPFSEADLDRITAAVKEAESKTSGEIVPYFVDQSDDYRVALWRGGVTAGATAMLLSLLVHTIVNIWLAYSMFELSATIAVGFSLGVFLVHIVPSFRRFFAGSSLMEHHVSQRASLAFLSEEVFNTRERTGILIFLSFFERKVVVLGDAGINAKAQPEDWKGIVQIVVQGMRDGHSVDGLVEAIRQCGVILQQHGVQRRVDDKDELSDNLRTGR
jgi:putative membrane protein